MCKKVEYLGHVVNEKGAHTSLDKIRAIQDAPTPKNVRQLCSLLGLVNYYGKFVPNLAALLHPLNQLLQKGVKWHWSLQYRETFKQIKDTLSSEKFLVHYDSALPLYLATDALAYGVGAVILHIYPDSTEYPIAYASRTLIPSEKNYSQIEKEALSLVFGIKKFHYYVYGF